MLMDQCIAKGDSQTGSLLQRCAELALPQQPELLEIEKGVSEGGERQNYCNVLGKRISSLQREVGSAKGENSLTLPNS